MILAILESRSILIKAQSPRIKDCIRMDKKQVTLIKHRWYLKLNLCFLTFLTMEVQKSFHFKALKKKLKKKLNLSPLLSKNLCFVIFVMAFMSMYQ